MKHCKFLFAMAAFSILAGCSERADTAIRRDAEIEIVVEETVGKRRVEEKIGQRTQIDFSVFMTEDRQNVD